MYGKAYSYREADEKLKELGFRLDHYGKNDHITYKRNPGERVVITYGKRFSQKTFNRELKNVGIILR